MEPLITTLAFKLGILADAITAVTGSLTGATMNLFTNNIDPTPTTPLTAYDLADYTGNGTEVITWNGVSISDGGEPEIVGVVGEFRPTDAVTPNTIYGCLLLDGAGALLAACKFLDGPRPMGDAQDAVVLAPRIRLENGCFVVIIS